MNLLQIQHFFRILSEYFAKIFDWKVILKHLSVIREFIFNF